MSDSRLAFIFPAFASDYTDHTGMKLDGFLSRFKLLMDVTQETFESSLRGFHFEQCNFLEDELLTQYVTYIYSCAASDTLRTKGFQPAFSAGYSMGIYAALYDAGVFNFTNGLQLIRAAYDAIRQLTIGHSFSMGILIGLGRHDLDRIIAQSGDEIEISNQNSPYAFVISGDTDQVLHALEAAREEGAIHTRQLNVKTPYHAGFLQEAALKFEKSVSNIDFNPPSCRIYSVINAQEIKNIESIKQELSNNLFHHLNWYNTMVVLLEKGVKTLIECGPSKGMIKNARFVQGDFNFIALDSV